jgi:hypothetical protein
MIAKRVKLGVAAAAVTAGGVAAMLSPASPAVAFFSPPLFLDVQVESPARLVARGAAVEVPLEVTCTSEEPAFVDVSVTQRVGNKIARGFGNARVGCTRQGQQIRVTVTAFSSNAFRTGTAFAEATIFGCAPTFCGSESDAETIEIQR